MHYLYLRSVWHIAGGRCEVPGTITEHITYILSMLCIVWDLVFCLPFVADEKQHFLIYSSPDKNVFIVQGLFRDVNKINQYCLNMLYASSLGSFIHIVDWTDWTRIMLNKKSLSTKKERISENFNAFVSVNLVYLNINHDFILFFK